MNTNEIDLIDLFDEFYILANDAIDNIQQPNPTVQILSKDTGEAERTTEAETVVAEMLASTPAKTETSTVSSISQTQSPSLSFAGANKQHIAFIYNDKIYDSKDNVEMIMNFITKALKFSLDDVAILRISKNNEYHITQILEELNCKKAVLWGCAELFTNENIHLAVHEVHAVKEIQVLNADAAHKYHNNQDLKMKLWEAAQKIFKQ